MAGYNSIKTIADGIKDKLEKPELLIADKFRQRASTLFALLDLPSERRESFYRHMGHSETMNKNVYQCPLAIMELVEVGGLIKKPDVQGPHSIGIYIYIYIYISRKNLIGLLRRP